MAAAANPPARCKSASDHDQSDEGVVHRGERRRKRFALREGRPPVRGSTVPPPVQQRRGDEAVQEIVANERRDRSTRRHALSSIRSSPSPLRGVAEGREHLPGEAVRRRGEEGGNGGRGRPIRADGARVQEKRSGEEGSAQRHGGRQIQAAQDGEEGDGAVDARAAMQRRRRPQSGQLLEVPRGRRGHPGRHPPGVVRESIQPRRRIPPQPDERVVVVVPAQNLGPRDEFAPPVVRLRLLPGGSAVAVSIRRAAAGGGGKAQQQPRPGGGARQEGARIPAGATRGDRHDAIPRDTEPLDDAGVVLIRKRAAQ
mmetsp:Transcript_28504/g.83897  ORF Transcript_28504/g.83897 Transcript_28504/m.83897 type:complete len:312 (-) Transcript_28504:264-1199(-)